MAVAIEPMRHALNGMSKMMCALAVGVAGRETAAAGTCVKAAAERHDWHRYAPPPVPPGVIPRGWLLQKDEDEVCLRKENRAEFACKIYFDK